MRVLAVAALLLSFAVGASAQDAPPAAPTPAQCLEDLRGGDVPTRRRAAYALWKMGGSIPEAVEALGAALTDPEAYVADIAGRILVRMGPKAAAAADHAVAALEDERPKVRLAGVLVLRALGAKGADAAGSLLSRLDDDDAEVRGATATTLGQMAYSLGGSAFASQVVAGLGGALEDPDARVRKEAAFALASFGERAIAAVDGLIARLSDETPEVRTFAANTIWSLGPAAGGAALDGLYGLLADPAKDVRSRAYGGIVQVGPDDPRLFEAMRRGMADEEPSVRQTCSWILGQNFADRPGVGGLLLAATKDASSPVRVNALICVAKVDPLPDGALAALEAGFLDRDPQIRSTAARVAGDMGDAAARLVPMLIDLLRDTEFFNDRGATTALGRLGPVAAEAIPELRRRWRTRRDPTDRAGAGVALARISSRDRPQVLAALLDALRGGSRELSVSDAAFWTGEAGPAAAEAVPLLRTHLRAADAILRMYATSALGKIGGAAEEALPDLEPLLRDADDRVARRAREAMAAIRAAKGGGR